MGQVTIFEKEDCMYCRKVLAILEKFRECVMDELAGKGEIVIKTVDCGKEGAYAAFCIRTTGTFTVPHVFFNEEYIGDATKFLGLDTTCKGGYNVLRNKLLDLATRPCPNPPFPPAPDASMIKVTDSLAFSSQPTGRQLGALQSFGLKGVLNVLRPDSPAFYKTEQSLVAGSGVTYSEAPIYVVTAANVLRALDVLAALPKPCLVHDDVGQRAGLLVLLAAARQMLQCRPAQAVTSSTVLQWGVDLGLELKPFRAIIDQVLASFSDQQQQQQAGIEQQQEQPQPQQQPCE